MSQIERDFMRHVDEIILSATPDILAKIGQIDMQAQLSGKTFYEDRKSTRLNSSHTDISRMPSSA